MKVIDLLNKIANREEVPEKVKYEYKDYVYKDNYEDYYCEEESRYLFETIVHDENWKLSYAMNIEVEIIEDTPEEEKKIPEKLGECAYVDGEIAYSWSKSEAILKTRINEIIDYLKSKGDNNE